jgi:DnaJ-class molecular chaperone
MVKTRILRKTITYEEVVIPEGHEVCSSCHGSGEIRKVWGPPGLEGQFRTCPDCRGIGFISCLKMKM